MGRPLPTGMRRLILHGGAGRIPLEREAEVREGLSGALRAGWGRISNALDAVEGAVGWMEDSGMFNCGKGAVLNLQGRAELDAAIMTHDRRAGAVSNLRRTPRAIRVARKVMEETPHVLLCGSGADRFARAMGYPAERIGTPSRQRLYRELRAELLGRSRSSGAWSDGRPSRHPAWWRPLQRLIKAHPELLHGTVGAVALDARGRLAAATSTGGIFLKMEGRVSDSSLVGCGTYADERIGLSATGIGEVIIRHTLTRAIAERYRSEGRGPQAAIEGLIATLPEDTVGIIALDRRGRFGRARNTAHLAYALRGDGDSSVRTGIS